MNQAIGGSGSGPDSGSDSAPVPDSARAPALVVGLDAGGTRTRAVLADAAGGSLLGEGAGGPGNALTVPLPRLTEHLAQAVARAVPESARGAVVAVAGGFAGATGADEDDPGRRNALTALTAALRRLDIATERLTVTSDIEAAFASAPGAPADGLALVAGTGAVAMRITDRRRAFTVDGDGWLLGDDGSGFWIGREAVRAALRMADGRGAATVLAGAVGQALGLPARVLPGPGSTAPRSADVDGSSARSGADEPSYGDGTRAGADQPSYGGWTRAGREAYRGHLLPVVMAEPPTRLARLAPLVAEAARERDAVARAILDRAVDQLTDAVRALAPRTGERVVATGGLLGPGGPLTAPLTTRLDALGLTLDLVADGCPGAVALARLSV
ncbi:BadF/BadG/BcrA/BcrD ATPase family protein [Streptomyces gilvifuscus]|uniref:BadF/BadG/BcrA/BcrD ATPase family protein n=1 Tax=Streptomyces gilvifuscus TaxID=1550617 RepID=A0ABT5FX05_9ACTN|nr:BadF/BadG/BcrA/BcrD ATPase family protein [Streptomyces gilvifuscus]MDC2956971.1 BadF/BadG/BcrA/BcrD ATPase family protein [Streptomyces gilvifuscus]